MRMAASRVAAAVAGLSAREIALIVAIGLVLGTFPVYGCPTLFCLIAALALRLNAPALQLVNQLSSPLQLALLVPFARAGWRIPVPSAAPAMWKLGALAFRSITGWFFLALPMGILLYFSLLLFLLRTRNSCFHGFESRAR